MALAWILAFAITSAASFLLSERGTPMKWPDAAARASVAVIGSSLMRQAVPTGPIHGGLLGDGRSHVRLAVDTITEATTIELLGLAVEAGSATILVEANALTSDLAFVSAEEARPWYDPTRVDFGPFGTQIKVGLLRLIGIEDRRDLTAETSKLTGRFDSVGFNFTPFYPLHLRAPSHRAALESALGRARRRGAEVILVAPPRSQSAAKYVGEKDMAALTRQMAGLANELALPLFRPAPFWPDDYFIDQGHMNQSGRDRFLNELASWHKARP